MEDLWPSVDQTYPLLTDALGSNVLTNEEEGIEKTGMASCNDFIRHRKKNSLVLIHLD